MPVQGAEVVPIWEEMIRGHLLLGALLASADNHKASGSEVLGGFSTERFELQQNDESLSDVSLCISHSTGPGVSCTAVCGCPEKVSWALNWHAVHSPHPGMESGHRLAQCSEDSMLGVQVSQECLGLLAPQHRHPPRH